ncbi:hypothetical protein Pmani_005281 [Petrolisthes manimaculis]|uniref:Uncharacterized protein n=1 Tax=Petrolisthes manimaculis TaxID=1843537 RepID=A0AAE1UGT3_9EUCA|nr:hypothetical protein Pmani_005281 [Petrolisthes manimaculis]
MCEDSGASFMPSSFVPRIRFPEQNRRLLFGRQFPARLNSGQSVSQVLESVCIPRLDCNGHEIAFRESDWPPSEARFA